MENVISTRHVIVSDDGMEAFLDSEGGTPETALSAGTLQALLESKGIVFGLLENDARTFTSGQAGEKKLMVAQGLAPVPGKDGWVEHCFGKQPSVSNNGADKKVDYHDLGWIHNVRKSSVVAIIHLPEAGIPGKTVLGFEIPAKPGKQATAKLGKGVAFDPVHTDHIIATEDGNATVDADGVLHVDHCLDIKGNVDYSTGDIDFVGSIRIAGDVKSNFTVKAGGSIEVQGNVEDATLESGGEVIVNNGFIGQGKGTIRAGGNVKVQHVLNQSVTSAGDITIGREAMCATLRAAEKICAPGCVFVGCVLEAGHEVEVFSLGNGDQTQAKVRVGKRAMLLEQISQSEKALQKIQKQIEETKSALYTLVRVQLDAGVLTSGQKELQKKLQQAQAVLGHSAESLQKTKELLQARLLENGLARIVVHDTLFANVFVELNGIRKMMQGAIKEVVLTERGGSIEEKPLE
jgi:uncharacterized protein